MAQYIDKSALVAEIEKCYNESQKKAKIFNFDFWNGNANAYHNVLAILDNKLDVKEVAAEQECICNGIFNRIVGNNWNLLIPLEKVGLKHGDKVKIFITKEK